MNPEFLLFGTDNQGCIAIRRDLCDLSASGVSPVSMTNEAAGVRGVEAAKLRVRRIGRSKVNLVCGLVAAFA